MSNRRVCPTGRGEGSGSDEPGIVGSGLWRLEKSYEDKYGYYIDDNYGEFGLIPFDEFMREAENDGRFFIGVTR